MIKKYRKKPVEVDAIQWTGWDDDNSDGWNDETFRVASEWSSNSIKGTIYLNKYETLVISTLEGDLQAQKGDYIIKGIKGEVYPCKPDVFEKTYTLVEPEPGIIDKNEIDFNKICDCIESVWNCDYGRLERTNNKLILATGGWSENESIINELEGTMFWFLYWQESKRGGYYEFGREGTKS